MGFPGGSIVKNLPDNAGDTGLISGLKGSPGEGNGKPLQYSCLGHANDRGASWATVHGVTKESDPTWQLNNCKLLILEDYIEECVLSFETWE